MELDANGWVPVSELIAKANAAGRTLDVATITKVVVENDKKRFTLSDDGKLIRAAQGHSVRLISV